jgi:hypothetical protein
LSLFSFSSEFKKIFFEIGLIFLAKMLYLSNLPMTKARSRAAAIYLVWITGFTKIMDIVYEKKKIPGVELLMQ